MSKLHTIENIVRLTGANVWESMGKLHSCAEFIKSLLQVMQVSVSGSCKPHKVDAGIMSQWVLWVHIQV